MAKQIFTALGVISGTSMDGIDVALVETDGRRRVSAGPGFTYPYPEEVRDRLLAVAADPQAAESEPLTELEAAVTAAHGDAIEHFLADARFTPESLDLIGFHGQTILHRPERRFTRQLGSGQTIAARFGVTTIGRFRHADIAAGGEGAPLAPLYHQALAADLPHPVMVLNLGGVGNVTFIDGDTVIAFDTGPASALIDDFVRRRRSLPFDAGGRIAAAGRPDTTLINRFASHAFFDRPAPKSLDRNDFHSLAQGIEHLSDEDGVATLAEFTVLATVSALRHVPRAPLRWLVTGGGRHNDHIMRRLAAELGIAVEPVEAVGWNGDFLEAQCFGYLAVRALLALPLSLPTTTGAPQPLMGGETFVPR